MAINIRNLDTEIHTAEEKLRELQEAKARIDSMPENQRLAELLHETHCHSNHTDGCTWYYEKNCATGEMDWAEFNHRRWLNKADEILEIADYDTISKIVNALSDLPYKRLSKW